jgi:hypothetical protein
MLDGATGFGVPSNVRQLYRFPCVNWFPGDEIYLFGFSRGAFTVRTLAAFVTHAEMEHYTRAAWRAYRKEIAPAGNRLLIWGARAIRDSMAACLAKIGWWPDYRQFKQDVRKDPARHEADQHGERYEPSRLLRPDRRLHLGRDGHELRGDEQRYHSGDTAQGEAPHG